MILLTINQIQKFVMRNVFTKFLMVSFLATLVSTVSFSQELNTLTVNAPAGLAGDYRVARALFGSQSNNAITADASFGAPVQGCTALTSNGSGKVVFLDRGTCAFDVKCLNAQNSGAVAVVICAVLVNETIQMMPAGAVAPQVTIPAFYASKETCDKLRVDLTSGGVNVTLKNKACPTPTYTSNAVWGDTAGEGDFSNGLGDWTTDKGWVHNPEGVVRNGAYTGGPKVVGSETYCNGVAEFNSDYLDNRGMTNPDGTPMAGIGDCPSVCTAYLLSPNITFANPIGGLTIEYSQSLRQFQSQYYIMVSRDGGATFSDTLRVNAEYPVNSNHNSERKRVAFLGFEGATQVRFKFECVGNYYYWAIDDVVVYDDSYVDLQVNRDWYSVSPYYKMPKSQVSEIPLMADVSNLGNAGAENAFLEVTISGPSFTQKKELIYGDFPANSVWENRPFAEVVNTPATVGRYTAEYKMTSTQEEDGANNRAGFEWHVTENTFANLDSEADFGSPYMGFYASPWLNIPNERIYSISNAYYVPKGANNGNPYVATKARYGLVNALADVTDQTIRIDLFEWVDADNSSTASADERTRVGTNFQIISSDIPDLRSIETDIWAVDEDGFPVEGERVKLKDNTHYLIAASVSPNIPATDPQMQLLGFTPRTLDNYYRSIGAILATNFALDSLQNLSVLSERASGSLFAFENITGTNIEDIDARNFRFIFNGALYTKAFLEMDIALASNTTETVLPTVAVKTFPNPAARDLFVELSLEKVSETVEVSIYGMDGKLVSTKTFNNVQDDRLKLDVSTFANGAYNVKVITSEGVASRKVIINN
jgi:hypothetical protein